MTGKAVAGRSWRAGVAVGIIVWTSIAWGGRIGLLNEGESAWAADWHRRLASE